MACVQQGCSALRVSLLSHLHDPCQKSVILVGANVFADLMLGVLAASTTRLSPCDLDPLCIAWRRKRSVLPWLHPWIGGRVFVVILVMQGWQRRSYAATRVSQSQVAVFVDMNAYHQRWCPEPPPPSIAGVPPGGRVAAARRRRERCPCGFGWALRGAVMQECGHHCAPGPVLVGEELGGE